MLDLCSMCAPRHAFEFRPIHVVLVNALGVGHYTPLIRIVPLLLSRSSDVRISIFSPIRERERQSCPPLENSENVYQRQYFLDGPDVHPITMAAILTRQDELTKAFVSMLNYTQEVLYWPPVDVLIHDPFALFAPYYHEKFMASNVKRFVFNSSNSLCWKFMKDGKCVQALLNGQKTFEVPFFPKDAGPVRIQLLWHMFSINVPDPVFNDSQMFQFADSALGAITNDIPNLYAVDDPKLISLAPLTVVYRDGKDSQEESDATIEWLDKHPPRSVTYIALGTLFPLPVGALIPLADAVEARGEPFLWAYRRRAEDVEGADEASISNERMAKLAKLDFGHVVEWTNQSAVLRHNALRVFVSHCGWNSLVEAIVSAGIPIIAIPIGAEQVMNALLMAEGLNMGEIALVEEDQNCGRQFDKSRIDGPFHDVVQNTDIKPTMWRMCNKEEWLQLFDRIKCHDLNALTVQVKAMSQITPGGGAFQQLDNFFEMISGHHS